VTPRALSAAESPLAEPGTTMQRLMSPTATHAVATWFTLIATAACVFAARALIAQVLGPVGIGRYALMLAAAWLAGTLLSVGLPAYNATFAGKEPPGVLLSNTIVWNGAALVVLSLVGIPFVLSTAASVTWKLMIVGVMMSPVMSLLECIRGILQGRRAIAAYNWLGLTAGTLNLAGVGALTLGMRLTLRTAVVCWIVSTMISALASVFVGQWISGGLGRIDRRALAGSLRFGGQAWISQLTGIVNLRSSLLLTEHLLGTAAVGIYAVALTIAEVLFYCPNAVAVVTTARYASASPAEAYALIKRSSAWVLAISVACAMAIAVLGGPIIALVFGSSYAASARALLILLPGVVAFTPVGVAIWYVNAHLRKPLVNLVIVGFSALLNMVLTIVWAPRYGVTGVAWATTSAFVAASLLAALLVVREGARVRNRVRP